MLVLLVLGTSGASKAANGPGANFLVGSQFLAVSKHKDNILAKFSVLVGCLFIPFIAKKRLR